MSLVPIIYTSLVLFFGLLMIVWIISYITFKKRAQSNPIIEEEKRKFQTYLTFAKPMFYNPMPLFHIYDKTEKIKLDVKQTHDKQRGISTRSAKKSQLTKTRITIVNKPVKADTKTAHTKTDEHSSTKNFSQFNIFSFYSDKVESDLVSAIVMPHSQAV